MSQTRQNKGFTLIELLVVIAIIAILAAISSPSSHKPANWPVPSVCTSNEKQISLGILMYVQDYDERFPVYQYPLPAGDPRQGKQDVSGGLYQDWDFGWDEACQPYIKNKQVEWCPSASSPGNDYTNPSKHDSDWTGSSNYATNCRLAGKYGPTAKLAQLTYPAQTILLSENGAQSSEGACRIETDEWGWTNSQVNALQQDAGSGTPPGPLRRHKNGSNYAYADGHVKWANGHSMGLLNDNTSNNAEVQALLNDSGNGPSYHLSPGN